MMRMYTAEERSRRRSLNQEMLALVERYLAGAATRVDLEVWARANRGPFSTGYAESLHTCLYCIADRNSDEPVVRDVDLEDHVRAMRAGFVHTDWQHVADIVLSVAEVCERAGTSSTRYCLEGIGWFDHTTVVSFLTGRQFSVSRHMDPNPAYPHCSVRTPGGPFTLEESAYVLADLRETLRVDDAVCKPPAQHSAQGA